MTPDHVAFLSRRLAPSGPQGLEVEQDAGQVRERITPQSVNRKASILKNPNQSEPFFPGSTVPFRRPTPDKDTQGNIRSASP